MMDIESRLNIDKQKPEGKEVRDLLSEGKIGSAVKGIEDSEKDTDKYFLSVVVEKGEVIDKFEKFLSEGRVDDAYALSENSRFPKDLSETVLEIAKKQFNKNILEGRTLEALRIAEKFKILSDKSENK